MLGFDGSGSSSCFVHVIFLKDHFAKQGLMYAPCHVVKVCRERGLISEMGKLFFIDLISYDEFSRFDTMFTLFVS